MNQWRVSCPVSSLVVCLLASLVVAGCAERRTKPVPSPGLRLVLSRGDRGVDMTWEGLDDACAVEHAGDACVSVDSSPRIWKDSPGNSGKPQRVKWWVDDAQKHMYYWTIAYMQKDPNDVNWIPGTIDPLDCSSNHTKMKDTNKVPGIEQPGVNLTWPYQITVWKCTNGERDLDECLCKTDPRIEILD